MRLPRERLQKAHTANCCQANGVIAADFEVTASVDARFHARLHLRRLKNLFRLLGIVTFPPEED